MKGPMRATDRDDKPASGFASSALSNSSSSTDRQLFE
jgi:hypothetical protein